MSSKSKKKTDKVQDKIDGLVTIILYLVIIPLLATMFSMGLIVTGMLSGESYNLFEVLFVGSLITMILTLLSKQKFELG